MSRRVDLLSPAFNACTLKFMHGTVILYIQIRMQNFGKGYGVKDRVKRFRKPYGYVELAVYW